MGGWGRGGGAAGDGHARAPAAGSLALHSRCPPFSRHICKRLRTHLATTLPQRHLASMTVHASPSPPCHRAPPFPPHDMSMAAALLALAGGAAGVTTMCLRKVSFSTVVAPRGMLRPAGRVTLRRSSSTWLGVW
jgi:hypothetical protein